MSQTEIKVTPDTPFSPENDVAGSIRNLAINGEHVNFILTVTERSEASIHGIIEEVTGWHLDAGKTPWDKELYLKFYLKWDSCCHVWFGEEEDGKSDGYLHLCGPEYWANHTALMTWLYQWAEKAIPMHD